MLSCVCQCGRAPSVPCQAPERVSESAAQQWRVMAGEQRTWGQRADWWDDSSRISTRWPLWSLSDIELSLLNADVGHSQGSGLKQMIAQALSCSPHTHMIGSESLHYKNRIIRTVTCTHNQLYFQPKLLFLSCCWYIETSGFPSVVA